MFFCVIQGDLRNYLRNSCIYIEYYIFNQTCIFSWAYIKNRSWAIPTILYNWLDHKPTTHSSPVRNFQDTTYKSRNSYSNWPVSLHHKQHVASQEFWMGKQLTFTLWSNQLYTMVDIAHNLIVLKYKLKGFLMF